MRSKEDVEQAKAEYRENNPPSGQMTVTDVHDFDLIGAERTGSAQHSRSSSPDLSILGDMLNEEDFFGNSNDDGFPNTAPPVASISFATAGPSPTSTFQNASYPPDSRIPSAPNSAFSLEDEINYDMSVVTQQISNTREAHIAADTAADICEQRYHSIDQADVPSYNNDWSRMFDDQSVGIDATIPATFDGQELDKSLYKEAELGNSCSVNNALSPQEAEWEQTTAKPKKLKRTQSFENEQPPHKKHYFETMPQHRLGYSDAFAI